MRRLIAALLFLLVAGPAWAQSPSLQTAPKGSTLRGAPTSAPVDANIQALDVFIRGGAGAGGTASTDNSAFTGGASSLTPSGALFDNTPPAITDGNVGIFRMNSTRVLMIDCVSGCTAGGSFADSSAFTFGTTSIAVSGAVVDDAATNTVAENSAGAPRMSTNRILYSHLTNNAGVSFGTAGAPIRIDPTGTTTQPISGTVTANAGSGTFTVGGTVAATQSGTWTVQPGNTPNTTPWLVRNNPSTVGTRTQVSDTASDTQLLASNANRRAATIYNDSTGTLLVGLGTTAVSSTNYSVRVFTEGHYTVPEGFTGEVRGLWLTDPNDGAARISELSP